MRRRRGKEITGAALFFVYNLALPPSRFSVWLNGDLPTFLLARF
jgi:hypothetical protein